MEQPIDYVYLYERAEKRRETVKKALVAGLYIVIGFTVCLIAQ